MTDLFDDRPNYGSARFPEPREFQQKAHESLRQGVRAGHRCQMLMAPTGAGKTYLGLRIIHEALVKARSATFVCDRTTLINQTSETADRYGLSAHGVMQASHWRTNGDMPFQIASAQTLARRDWPRSDVVVVDEAHTQLSAWVDHIKSYADKPLTEGPLFIGLSATPFSKGLGKLFSNLVNATTMDELTRSGVLVPMRVLSCSRPDMTGAAMSGGEWTDGAAAERGMAIVGDVVREWAAHGENRKTIVFGATIAHCEELARQFIEAGVLAAVFTSHTKDHERVELLKEYRKPDSSLRVLISVEALAKGFDVPDVGCVIDCRPLRKSLSTAIQMWGRGLRASPETGKKDCILLDHSGNILRFKDDYEDVFFNGLGALDSGEKLDAAQRKEPDDEKEVKACPSCGYKPFTRRCMACGHQHTAMPLIEADSGVMREVMIGKRKLAEDKLHLWGQVASYARAHSAPDKQQGRAAHLYREMTGEWPPRSWHVSTTPGVEITRNVMNQIRSRAIAFAATRAKAASHAA